MRFYNADADTEYAKLATDIDNAVNGLPENATSNQKYEAAKKAGFKGSFSNFAEYLNKGYLEKGVDLAIKIRGLFGQGYDPTAASNLPPASDADTKILGMPKPVFYIVGGVVAVLIGFGIYKLIKKK
jgi:hypothetical protein